MKEVVDYMIISKRLKGKSLFSKNSYTEADFAKLINQKIKEGWQPLGGAFMDNLRADTYVKRRINQTLVKYK